MNTRRLFSMILAFFLVGAGCTTAPSKQNIQTRSADVSATQQLVARNNAASFQRSAEPEWNTITFDRATLSIPYSSAWSVARTTLSVFDTNATTGTVEISFGRPVTTGMSVIREYTLSQQPKISLDLTHRNNGSLATLKDLLSCVDGYPAQRKRIGTITGIAYHFGGAKGCSTGFLFNQGNHSYDLTHIPDIGKQPSEITDEMERIITSVHEK